MHYAKVFLVMRQVDFFLFLLSNKLENENWRKNEEYNNMKQHDLFNQD